MYALRGQTALHVPHWMHWCSFAPPPTADAISSANPESSCASKRDWSLIGRHLFRDPSVRVSFASKT
jgi:hypothetical protein